MSHVRMLAAVSLACVFSIAPVHAAESDVSRLYERLDSLVAVQPQLTEAKIRKIELIRNTLSEQHMTDVERYGIQERLYEEYAAFKYDSAYKYVNKNIDLAAKMNDSFRLTKSRLDCVHIASVSGMFDEAADILNSIDVETLPNELQLSYYIQTCELYLAKAQFMQMTPYYNSYIDKVKNSRREIISRCDKSSLTYATTMADLECQGGKYTRAVAILKEALKALSSGERMYSVVTSTLAYYYQCMGDSLNQRRFLLLSAISDTEGCIRENNSMRELSDLLFNEGDIDRAYGYLNVSIEDANFYGTRLRTVQASQLIPTVLKAYQKQQREQNRRIYITIAITLLVALLLAAALVTTYVMMKRYLRANKKIHDLNTELNQMVEQQAVVNERMKEGNKIKEEYIARFLDLSSTYIEKAEEQRKLENRLARDHRMAELYAELKSSRLLNENTRLFYQNFDSAFLSIYPNFVKKVNTLLAEDGQIWPKDGEKMTTELRILALIRLGITDNNKIASILRSSISTIYTYRSKLKNRSVSPGNFEELIKNIDAYA